MCVGGGVVRSKRWWLLLTWEVGPVPWVLGMGALHTWAWGHCTPGMEQGDYANQFPLKRELGRTLNKSPNAVQGFNTKY